MSCTDDIIKMFGIAKIEERFYSIYQEMVDFISQSNLSKYVEVNTELLNVAIYDYFGHMYEFCKFHKLNCVNAERVIAHTAYWLLRYKPLQIVRVQETYIKKLNTINERFILLYVLNYLSDRLGGTHILVRSDKSMIEFSERLFYYFVVGMPDAQSLESVVNLFLGGAGF